MSCLLRNGLSALSLRLLPAFRNHGSLSATTEAGSFLSALGIAANQLSQVPVNKHRWWNQQSRLFSALAEPQADTEAEVQLTDSAAQKLRQLVSTSSDQGSFLRVIVEAGGCSGFSYKFDMDTAMREGDRVFEAGGVKLAIDPVSLEFVRGAKVDYTQELMKSAFEVVDNPNADKGCGCGTSFSPK